MDTKFKIGHQSHRFFSMALVFVLSFFFLPNSKGQLILFDSCRQATPVCGNNIYSYTVGGSPALAGGNECCDGDIYPQCCANYGCLSAPGVVGNPRWFYFKILQPGHISLSLTLIPYVGAVGRYVCWGPFDDPVSPCVDNLITEKIITCCDWGVECRDTIDIPFAISDKYYIFVIESCYYTGVYPNFQPVQLTFYQSNIGQPGAGSTTCDLVTDCNMLHFTANPGVCNGTTNTYSVGGLVYFVNPPQTGPLVIWDDVSGISLTFDPPFTSPLSYTFTGLPCDNQQHTFTASFWNAANCDITAQFQAPVICPDATISGGGTVCDDGEDQAPVSISFTPNALPPYTFSWFLNNLLQPPVQNYSGPFPYTFFTDQPGTYTMASSQNALCQGLVSGQATINLVPVPITNLGQDTIICSGTNIVLDAGAGFSSYLWNTGQNSRTIQVSHSGQFSVVVTNSDGCTNTDTIVVSTRPPILPNQIKHE